MKMGIKISLLFISVSLVLSCGTQRVKDSTEYIAYLENEKHGLRKNIILDNYKYDIQLRTPEYVVILEQLESIQKTQTRLNQLQQTIWFSIRISISNYGESPLRYRVNGLEGYNQRLDYYLNEASNDIYLMYGTDTLYLSSYWFENNHNLLPFETIILCFLLPDKNINKDLLLSFHDRVTNHGIIKAKFFNKHIQHIPLIIF